MLKVLESTYQKARNAESNSNAERDAVAQMLDLLDQGLADSEPDLGFKYLSASYAWGRSPEIKNRMRAIAKKQFGLFAAQDERKAFQHVLGMLQEDSNRVFWVLDLLESHIVTTERGDLRDNRINLLLELAKDERSGALAKRLQAVRHREIAQDCLQSYLLNASEIAYRASPPEFETHLAKIFETAKIIEKDSVLDCLAAGLWAYMFAAYAANDRKAAILHGMKLADKAPAGGAMAKQIANSLLAICDPQQSLPLFPLLPGAIPPGSAPPRP